VREVSLEDENLTKENKNLNFKNEEKCIAEFELNL